MNMGYAIVKFKHKVNAIRLIQGVRNLVLIVLGGRGFYVWEEDRVQI